MTFAIVVALAFAAVMGAYRRGLQMSRWWLLLPAFSTLTVIWLTRLGRSLLTHMYDMPAELVFLQIGWRYAGLVLLLGCSIAGQIAVTFICHLPYLAVWMFPEHPVRLRRCFLFASLGVTGILLIQMAIVMVFGRVLRVH